MPKANWFTSNPFLAESGSFNVNLDQEHMYFLLYWLNKHVFPNKSKGMKLEWIPLAIPIPFFDSIHCGTSYCFHSPEEFTFRATRRSLKVISKVVQKLLTLNFECTSTFFTWWEAKWIKKYRRDLHEAYDHFFNQLSLKSYPSSGKLENWKEMAIKRTNIGSDEEDADTLILQEAAIEAKRRDAGEDADISELFGYSEAKEELEANTRAPRRARTVMVETSDSKPEKQPKPKQATLTGKIQKLRPLNPQKLHLLQIPLRDEPLGIEMRRRAKEHQNVILKELEVIIPQASWVNPIDVPEASEVPVSQPQQSGEVTSPPPPSKASGLGKSPPCMVREAPSTLSTSSLPNLVKKFGQIKTKLQSPSTSFESHSFQNARQIFKDWMKKDFTASFSLKTLHDAEKALIELYQAQLLSQAKYKSFLSFFENLRALRD
ncbi:hypothetical protein D8674_031122 [Pyrus ussuriensis x Pyrus communis]|uniref:Aminotransferase-like plant mobile domain-containing protein n=1 Tax=Pyrus ussuriensis x Pyrus communis TaxID=2448454 RepID=A0A5N5F331_9ROSA|nr:hypothetical protein D8674_031122 [Pyrus ussuriensis x Pyrus communis]